MIGIPPASPQQTDSCIQGWVEELRERGSAVCTPSPSPADSFTLFTPSLVAPSSLYNSNPLNYKQECMFLPLLLYNCPSTPFKEAWYLHYMLQNGLLGTN